REGRVRVGLVARPPEGEDAARRGELRDRGSRVGGVHGVDGRADELRGRGLLGVGAGDRGEQQGVIDPLGPEQGVLGGLREVDRDAAFRVVVGGEADRGGKEKRNSSLGGSRQIGGGPRARRGENDRFVLPGQGARRDRQRDTHRGGAG